jgi:acetylglutamate kinase
MKEFKEWIEKAHILLEALPYIKQFSGSTMVIKIGGEPMINEESKNNLALDLILMKYVGINPVVIHGGGKQISSLMHNLGKKAIFIDGLRVTDKETMNITEMVLTGMVNKDLVGILNHHGGKAVGISGKDGNLIQAEKLKSTKHDYGFVGKIKKINTEIITTLNTQGFIPIISPIGIGPKGDSFNINADTSASRIAASLKAKKLITLSNVRGIYKDPEDEKTFIPSIKETEIEKLIKNKNISSGMLPKVESLIYALKNGVEKAHIINGMIPHSIILEIFTEAGIGTEIIN